MKMKNNYKKMCEYIAPEASEICLVIEGAILSGSTELFYDESDPNNTRFGDSWLES